jgi:hypothetical protein
MKKNRFYYSHAQEQLIEDMRIFEEDDDGKSTYIKLDSGELVKYTEWCSSKDSISNWDDAVIVYETDDDKDAWSRIIRK